MQNLRGFCVVPYLPYTHPSLKMGFRYKVDTNRVRHFNPPSYNHYAKLAGRSYKFFLRLSFRLEFLAVTYAHGEYGKNGVHAIKGMLEFCWNFENEKP